MHPDKEVKIQPCSRKQKEKVKMKTKLKAIEAIPQEHNMTKHSEQP